VETALQRAPDGPPTRALARALVGAGTLYFFRGDLAACTPYFIRAIDACLAVGDISAAALSHSVLGMTMQFRGDAERARTLIAQGLALAEQTGDDSLLGSILVQQGHISLLQGDFAGARARRSKTASHADSAGATSGYRPRRTPSWATRRAARATTRVPANCT
jgi:hypothetical protein